MRVFVSVLPSGQVSMIGESGGGGRRRTEGCRRAGEFGPFPLLDPLLFMCIQADSN